MRLERLDEAVGQAAHEADGVGEQHHQGEELVDRYFTGTVSRIGGIDLGGIAGGVAVRHAVANPKRPEERRPSQVELSAASTSGAARASTTSSIRRRCSSCSTPHGRAYKIFKEYSPMVDDQSRTWPRCAACSLPPPARRVPIDEVESVDLS